MSLRQQRQGRIAPAFQDTYDKLLAIRNKLEKLTLTQAWSLRETDLWDFQRQLDRIDESREDGNFFDAVGRPAEIYEQRVRCGDNTDLRTMADMIVDTVISSPEELCAHLPATLNLGTGFGGLTAYLQPADDIEEVPVRGEETWRCVITTRALPI